MHVFSFESCLADDNRHSDYAVIFLGLETPDAATIDDAYVSWSESNVPPPTTLIIGKTDAMRQFYDQLANPQGRLTKLDRLYKHGDVVLCGFDYTGQVSKVDKQASKPTDLTELFYDAVRAFVAKQIEETDVVIPAPPSIYFEKLSNRFSSHFIRAEALLKSTTCIEMLALRLLKPFNDWRSKSLISASDTVNIFLDTMGVWPVAEKLSQLHLVRNPNPVQYRIESFKSYDGIAKWDPPMRPAFVIISATTSGGLAEKVRAKIGAANAELWTMMILAPAGQDTAEAKRCDESKSIYQLSRKLKGRPSLDGMRDEFQTDIASIPPGAETISIVGERFLSQPVKPKRVRLVHKSLEDGAKNVLAKLARKHAVKIARGRFDTQSRWSISFDFNKLLDMACSAERPKADSLLKDWLRNYSSPSPVAIVYPSAEGASAPEVVQAAADLAQRTEDVLKELAPGAEVFKLTSDELAKTSRPFPHELKHCSIIVVAPVIGNGFVFKQISALLRHEQPKGPRLFLALAVLPESQAHLAQLKNDITLGLADRSYEFKFQFAVPIGRLDSAVQWLAEIEVLHDLEERMAQMGIEAPVVTARTRLLEEYRVLEDQSVFLPSAQEKPLLLSTGFFLWPGSTEISGNNYGGAVLLSIAALLQAARTSASKADDTSLRTGLFQHALICPETFTRFNDAIIQAALLRAAYPAELNYSVSPEMSHDMERLLLKWLQYFDQPAGAAASEFLLAIAIGKLKLRRDHLCKVLNYAKNLPGWISCLAGVAEKRVIKTA